MAILNTLDSVADQDRHIADEAMARRLLDDALIVRETIGFVDGRAYSLLATQRRSAALEHQATRQTWQILAGDRCASVRKATVKGRAMREVRFPEPGLAAKGGDTGTPKPPHTPL
jgi:hypothetical protein